MKQLVLFYLSIFCFIMSLNESFSQPVSPNKVTIKIISTTDVHGAIFPYDFIEDEPVNSSLAQVYSYVKEQRSIKGQEVILLDNGDFLQGQPVVYYANYEDNNRLHICADVMNYMQYDAASVGNHDIETGHEVYDSLVNKFSFPWMAANAINVKTGEPYFKPYTVITRQGIKIAIIGLITPGIPNWLPVKLWEGIIFEDMIVAAEKWMQIVQEKENPDIVIGLFHSGVDYTYNNQTEGTLKNENASKLIAERVSGFDYIIAGHDHQEFNLLITNPSGEKTLLIDARNSAKMVGVATIELIKNQETNKYEKTITGMTLEMNNCEPDSDFMRKYSDYVQVIKSYVSRPVAHFTRTISSRDALFGNSSFVDIIHEIQLKTTGADISFSAPLSYDSKIMKGQVYVRDMFKLYKFENLLYTMRLSGKEIYDYLEYSYSWWFNTMESKYDHLLRFYTDNNGNERLLAKFYNFSSAAGINYTVDLTKPAGSKVTISTLSNGEPFNLNKYYVVAINSYRGNGGGGHLTDGAKISMDDLHLRILSTTNNDLRFITMKWLEEQNVVSPKALGNWRAIPDEYWKKGRKRDYKLLYEN